MHPLNALEALLDAEQQWDERDQSVFVTCDLERSATHGDEPTARDEAGLRRKAHVGLLAGDVAIETPRTVSGELAVAAATASPPPPARSRAPSTRSSRA